MTGERPIGEDDLQAFVDGRLPPERLAAVKAYLDVNPATATQVGSEIEQREALRAKLAFKAREPIPSRLRVTNLIAAKRSPRRVASAWAAALVGLVVGLSAGAGGGAWWMSRHSKGQVQAASVAEDAIVAYRTYVSEKLHPVEVAADQEAHLVQWLSRRVGKPLFAPDLKDQGYRLIGGRLLPAGNEPAALFMYEDEGGHRLTVYARASEAEEQTSFRFESRAGVSAFSWIDKGLSYVVSARSDRARLLTVSEAIYRQFESAPAASRSRL